MKETDFLESFKKFAAGLLILLLAVIMGVFMFLPGSISEYTGALTSSGLGKFEGKVIPLKNYQIAFDFCKQRMARFNFNSDQFTRRCAKNRVKSLYVIPSVGRSFGLKVSKESVTTSVFEQVKLQHAQREQTITEDDDRLSIKELYLRELRYYPMDLRLLEANAMQANQTLVYNFPYPVSALESEELVTKITMDVKYIQVNDGVLFSKINQDHKIDEDKIRAEYKKEQAKLAKDKQRPYEKRKAAIKNRLNSELNQKALKTLKAELKKLKPGFGLADVSKITGIPVAELSKISLQKLQNARTKKGRPLKITQPELLANLKPGKEIFVGGPYKDGANTLYVEISNVVVPEINSEDKDLKTKSEKKGSELANTLLNLMVDKSALRGSFQLKIPKALNR